MTLIKLSQDFINAARFGQATQPYVESLSHITTHQLVSELTNDQLKNTFWINLYNGLVQYYLTHWPKSYHRPWRFFHHHQIKLADQTLSLNLIEHGIMRRSQTWWGLGYLPKLLPSSFEKSVRVDKLDSRIHFAINCGSLSCPPIRFYTPKTLSSQLDLATSAYLSDSVTHFPADNTIHVPKLLLYFIGDFGGRSGILKLLNDHHLINKKACPRLIYLPFSWQMYLKNYAL